MTKIYHTKLTPTAITATTAAAGYPALNLANEKLAKPYRATGTGANDITIDLGAVKALAALELHDVNFAAATISTSDDNVTYTPRGTLTTYANVHGRRRGLLPLPSLAARYVRASLTAGNRIYASKLTGLAVIDAVTNTVVTTIAAGAGPYGSAVNASGTRAYVANLGSGTVSVIDTATNAVIASPAVGSSPQYPAVNPAGTRVYVSNGGGTVSVIDTASNTVVATVAVGSSPGAIAVNRAGTRVYVCNGGGGTVSVIDTASNTVVATIGVGTLPLGIAIDPTDSRVYASNGTGGSVSVINTASNAVIATIGVGGSPRGVAVNPAGTRVYVANLADDTISIIDTANNTVIATVSVHDQPQSICFNASGTKIYVGNAGAIGISILDAGSNAILGQISAVTGIYVVSVGGIESSDSLAYYRAGAAYVMATSAVLARSPNKGYVVKTTFPRVSTKLANGRTAFATTGLPVDEITFAFLRHYAESLDEFTQQLRLGTVIVDMGLPQFPSHIWPVTNIEETSTRVFPKTNSESSSVTLTEDV